MPLLDRATLADLPAGIARPAYSVDTVTPGIVHLGLGAFHRAHQAAYVDACLAAGETGWGIVGVSLRSPATRDALMPQDRLYTLATAHPDGERLRVIGALCGLLVAPEDPQAVLSAMARPETRIVSLTVTEKAYPRTADGALDESDAEVLADLQDPGRPVGILGFLTEALARRRAAGIAPFTVLSCDNLPANGALLRRLLIDFAERRDATLARHIAETVACPSTMVDRIVPATSAEDGERISAALGVTDRWPVVAEPFMQWVIEDDFPLGRPNWHAHGVEMVRDVHPFEEMKLRLLNGAHSALAYAGLLMGRETVAEAFGDPLIRGFVQRLWRESAATLTPAAGLDAEIYTRRLTERFDNPALRHRTAQIATDGSKKLPQRFIAPALARLDSHGAAPHLALAIALWIAALAARREPAAFTDPLDARLVPLLKGKGAPRDTVSTVFSTARFAAHPPLLEAVAEALERLQRDGVQQTLAIAADDEERP